MINDEPCTGCGERANCPGHMFMRRSYYENGVYNGSDGRIMQTPGFAAMKHYVPDYPRAGSGRG